MPSNHNFEHLSLILRQQGDARFSGRPPISQKTKDNKKNRTFHASSLKTQTLDASSHWKNNQKQRLSDGLPEFDAGIPLVLKIDTSLDLDELRNHFSFEIVSEEEDGFVIVASEDIDLVAFQSKINAFISNITGSASIACIHELLEDRTQEERLKLILSESLFKEWANVTDESLWVCDVSVACIGQWEVPKMPKRNPKWKDSIWAKKENNWSNNRLEAYQKWDELKDSRLDVIQSILDFYKAETLMNVDNVDVRTLTLPDSFTLRIKISGKGLKDLVLSYPYIFEVTEPDDIETPQGIDRELIEIESQVKILEPPLDAPTVCVIDSGIQEKHTWLEPGIDGERSYCFVRGEPHDKIADFVRPSGHGTRIAGAILFGEEIPKAGLVKLESWIQNARVLNSDCGMPKEMFPPAILREVINHFHNSGEKKTRIFNHSINADTPSRLRHMSTWAAEIDLLCYEYDILIIQSSGNLKRSRPSPRLGVAEHLTNGKQYPEYLDEPSSRVANPGQSLQALTVGSVAYGLFENEEWSSFASKKGQPSAFSRSGLGIWQTIKPEVVEYGGDYLRTKSSSPDIDNPKVGADCYPELLRANLYGGPAFDRDDVGTSYATPKVTRIAARLQSLFPKHSCLLYRALIVQSAQWPKWAENCSSDQKLSVLRRLGYGIPDTERATTNTDYRTTYISDKDRLIGFKECHVYQVPIPSKLNRPGYDFDIRIDVTLSYTATPRRTRRNLRKYLSTWVDWISNRKGESIEAFKSRALKAGDKIDENEGAFGWTIESKQNTGVIRNVPRNSGTVQKDWTILKSNALPDDFCIAVRGHQGWSLDPDAKARYSLVISFEILGQEIPIYDSLRTAALQLQQKLDSKVQLQFELETYSEGEIEV